MPAPKWSPTAPGLVEDPESGVYYFGERQTLKTIYNGKYSDCVAAALPRGTIGSGDKTGFVVGSCEVSRARGEIGRIVTIWEGSEGSILPLDEFSLRPQDLNPATEKK